MSETVMLDVLSHVELTDGITERLSILVKPTSVQFSELIRPQSSKSNCDVC